jgi:adenylate cyclase, class 1
MTSQVIDTHHIDEGLDRKQLAQLKQRFLNLNQQRFERACTSLSERQQQFILLLPLLFHVNHPMLPGYISGSTPAGIYGFKPDKETLRMARILARSFQYTRDFTEKTLGIEALFLMGSAGSIAQSDTSDLDIWVCHNPHLNSAQYQALERKCELISQWAAQYIHLETHFFLMTGDSFQNGKCSNLSSEASGSAQHYLLLDEFYRTALWIAGKVPHPRKKIILITLSNCWANVL